MTPLPEAMVEKAAAALHDRIQPGEFTCGDLARAALEAIPLAELLEAARRVTESWEADYPIDHAIRGLAAAVEKMKGGAA